MAIMVLLCLCACGSLGGARPGFCDRWQPLLVVQGLIVLAGVDGAALRAFFKPSLGALLSLLPPSVFKLHHCRRAGEGSCDACDCCMMGENPSSVELIEAQQGIDLGARRKRSCQGVRQRADILQ